MCLWQRKEVLMFSFIKEKETEIMPRVSEFERDLTFMLHKLRVLVA